MWAESTALFPSVYFSAQLTTTEVEKLIRGRIREAQREKYVPTILPYIRFRYLNGGFLSEIDLEAVLRTIYDSNASGLVIWGSSLDVNTPEKCYDLLDFVEYTLGPLISKYTETTKTNLLVDIVAGPSTSLVAENQLTSTKPFKVYWNVPTMKCVTQNIYFDYIFEKFGIIPHTQDEIVMLLKPGNFPSISLSSGEVFNGGVPQNGDLDRYLAAFMATVDYKIPNANFTGIAVIDFGEWRPLLNHNVDELQRYKDKTNSVEAELHPAWPNKWITYEGKYRFEKSARAFMEMTLRFAKKMRPKATWGYFGYPYCYDMKAPNNCTLENNQ
ncbi:hyaluronidase-like [Leptidea sinapis]|uniref:hyaluronidase-like n=1 Tax=Leptidea sinapis TaxID=189913 RepID=UPI0021C3762E|nr:hyaluronidase-like [Leptidea sinapis]